MSALKVEDTDEVSTNRAADTAIVHLKDFLFAFNNQCIIDANLSKLHKMKEIELSAGQTFKMS